MYGYGTAVLPSLSFLELSNPKQQEWATKILTVHSIVIQAIKGMCSDFERLLKAVPHLRSLEILTDTESACDVDRDMQTVRAPVHMRHLNTLLIGDSHRISLDVLIARALRHLFYRIDHSCDLASDYAKSIMRLEEVRHFIFRSNLASTLRTLVVSIDPAMPVEREAAEALLQGLIALTNLVLCMGGEEPYRNLGNHSLNLPLLKTAHFYIFNPLSVRHIADFARSHTGVETVRIHWFTNPEHQYHLVHQATLEVKSSLRALASEGQVWNEVGAGHYKLDR